jgi:hypothetical protein
MSWTLGIGDIHGCLTAIRAMDDGVRFGEDDVVITLCDYVDQGPTSNGVIDLLFALRQRC